MTIYEERTITTRRGKTDEYVELFREGIKPAFEAEGGEVLRMVSGLIGAPATELIVVTRFADIASWERAQGQISAERNACVESENVRLMRSIASRPKQVIPVEDKRQVFGYRRFLIDPKDLDDFVRYSEEGIWPRVEAQGACVLGLWTLVASTVPQEIVLLTGYDSATNWEQTRSNQPMPEHFDEQMQQKCREMYRQRYELPFKTWVQLMQAVEL
ncbi:MAG: hypothetical protein O3A33_06210 [Chloroflexi bacterium]|nr:hypothetical protein [Chloroflexota bacterium]